MLWAGKTLLERCALFHRRFPDRWLYPSKLTRLYHKHGIRRKKIRTHKYTHNMTLTRH